MVKLPCPCFTTISRPGLALMCEGEGMLRSEMATKRPGYKHMRSAVLGSQMLRYNLGDTAGEKAEVHWKRSICRGRFLRPLMQSQQRRARSLSVSGRNGRTYHLESICGFSGGGGSNHLEERGSKCRPPNHEGARCVPSRARRPIRPVRSGRTSIIHSWCGYPHQSAV